MKEFNIDDFIIDNRVIEQQIILDTFIEDAIVEMQEDKLMLMVTNILIYLAQDWLNRG